MRDEDFVSVSMVQELEREARFLRERCALLDERSVRAEVAVHLLEQAVGSDSHEETKNLASLAMSTLLGGTRCSKPAGESDIHK